MFFVNRYYLFSMIFNNLQKKKKTLTKLWNIFDILKVALVLKSVLSFLCGELIC